MAKNTFISVGGTAKRVGKLYVGVGGVAKKVSRGYIGVAGVAKLFFSGEPVVIFESAEAGTYSVNLSAGKYEITIIGAGGGAAGARSSSVNNHHYAQGGVGGTLQFIANLPTASTLAVVVGAGGQTKSGTFSGAGTTITGVAGGNSTITGFGSLTIKAGGGTAGQCVSTSSSAMNRTVGVMGTNTISGSPAATITINNPTTIASLQSTSTGTSRTASGCANTNWEEDTTRGKSGDHGWRTTTMINMIGADGFVRIKML
jgi:hypothetical protein